MPGTLDVMATPAAVEPRTACPACGGQVHPIAGRCKHCRADLARFRNGAAPATSPAQRPNLAALGGNGHGANGTANGTTNGTTNGTAPRLSPMPAVMMPPPSDAEVAPRAGWSSRWPLVVAFIAVLAIVASVALLLFGGESGKKDRGVRRFEGPAPELTPTDPLAPQATPPAPPPNSGAPHAGIAPDPDPVPAPAPPPVPAPPSSRGVGPRTASDFFTTAVDVACQRISTCSADDQLTQYCDMARQTLPQIGQSMDQMCPDYDRAAAAECLDAVSRFPCPSGTLDPMAMGDTLMALSGCQKVCASAFAGMGGMVGGSLGMTP